MMDKEQLKKEMNSIMEYIDNGHNAGNVKLARELFNSMDFGDFRALKVLCQKQIYHTLKYDSLSVFGDWENELKRDISMQKVRSKEEMELVSSHLTNIVKDTLKRSILCGFMNTTDEYINEISNVKLNFKIDYTKLDEIVDKVVSFKFERIPDDYEQG